MGKKVTITLADKSVIHGVRYWWDVFSDGWGNTVVHVDGRIVKITNRWVIKVEDGDGEKDAVEDRDILRETSRSR